MHPILRRTSAAKALRFGALLGAAALTAACAQLPFTPEPAPRSALKTPQAFQNSMVLQREMPVPVWGWAEPGETVRVHFGAVDVSAMAGADGKWAVKLPAMSASAEGRTLTVSDSVDTIAFEDVLVGEVWMLSGQSNAESTLAWCQPEIGRTAENPRMRFFKVDHITSQKPQEDTRGVWRACEPENALQFSAVGYWFAKRLIDELDVPVGILDDNWGGSAIRFWVPLEGWAMVPELQPELERRQAELVQYREAMTKYFEDFEAWKSEAKAAVEAGDFSENPPSAPRPNEFGVMYNGMVAPVVPYAMRGILWYQGESNAGEDMVYARKMQALAASWRKAWGKQDLPFYYVQLPNFQQPNDDPAGGDGWARFREVQRNALEIIPNSAMAVTVDVGEAADIHPKNKVDVGERLARIALARDYGRDVVWQSPLFKKIAIEDGAIRVHFDGVGSGLMVGKKEYWGPVEEDEDGKLKRFAVAGEDQQWRWAEARIDGDTVVVSSPEVPKPVAVRYAYSMNPEGCNLYNKEGLPASPFRSDDW